MASVAKRTWVHKGEEKTAWVVRYTDSSGKRRMKTFPQKKAADRFRTTVETEISNGTHICASETLTVRKLCDLYIKHNEDRVADGRLTKSSFITIRNHVRGIELRLGQQKVTDLTALMVEKFYRDTCREDGLLPMTAKKRVHHLQAVEAFGIKRGYIKRGSAAADVLQELRAVSRVAIRTFTVAEMRQLLDALQTKRWRGEARAHAFLKCIVYVAVFCGLRKGEILALTRENVNFAHGIIQVRHSLSEIDGLKGPKTKAGVRDVPMPSMVARLLSEWLDKYHIENEDDFVFRTDMGKRHKWSSVHFSMWKPLLKRAGLSSEFHFHALRHFAASFMVSNNLPITEVAQLLGHAKVDMTLSVYAHALMGRQRQGDAIERMSQALVTASVIIDATSVQHASLSL